VDTTNIVNTASGGNLTVASLTVNVAPGLLTRMDTGTGMLTLGGNVTFNANASGRAQLSGNLALGGATRTLTINSGIHATDDMIIDAVISGGASFGLTKAGGGHLRLSGANTFDGALTINGSSGSVILGHPQALGTPSTARTATVSSGSTLAFDGVGITDPLNRLALNLNGTGNSRHGTVSGALVNLAGSNTVPCAVALAGNTQIAAKQDKLTLTGAFTGAYTLTVCGPGETALAGANGAIPSATAITVTSNGVFTLENTALTNSANRLGTMTLTLAGGTLRFSHDGGAANYSEACGALTINTGSNTVYASQAAGGQTSALTFSSITCAGGTVDFVGDGLGTSAQNRIFITGQADGLIGPWATINGTAPAMYSSTLGVYAGVITELGVAALGGEAASVIPNNDAASAVINQAGSAGPITLESVWTNRILEVRNEWATTSTVVRMVEGVTNRTLQTSRIAIGTGKASLTIGENDNEGALMALSTGGTLSLENQNASETLAVKSAIPNNGATASGLSKFGAGSVVLTGSNSYFGATLVNEGSLEFGGALAQRLDGVISGAGTLVKSGTNQLHLFGANTFTGPMYVNSGLVRPNQNTAFGSTAAGTFIASGATLDVGCDKSVGGTRYNDNLNMGAEEFTVSGSGIDGGGVIVNNGGSNQMSSVQRVLLSGDATFGGKMRWDVRSGYLFLNDHSLTKTGMNEIAIVSVPVYAGSGNMVVNQGLLRIESSTLMNGSASNSVTVNRDAKLELYLLTPFVPAWSLILNEGAFFQGSGNNSSSTNLNVWGGPVTLNGRAFFNGNASPAHWTVSGAISGSGPLIKAGNGGATLWLTGTNNTYSGGTILSNGTLYARYPGSLPGYNDGRLTVAGGGTLVVHASDGSFGFTAEQIRDLNAASAFVANNAYLGVDTTFANLACPYDLPKRMGVTKLGSAFLTDTVDIHSLTSFTVHLFNQSGAAVSGTVNLTIRGF
jgi:autotransporter-associated beta strand protein